MKELTWEEIFDLYGEDLENYINTHNPPLPIPVIPKYGESEDDIIDKWVYNYIINGPYKNGTLTTRESMCLSRYELDTYLKKFKKIKYEKFTEEDYNNCLW